MLWSSNLGPLVFRHHIWHNSSLEYHTGMKFTQKWILYEMQITGTWWRHYPIQNTHTHTHLTALFPGLPRWAGTRKVKPIWILLKQETVSGSGISWDTCKSAPHSIQITMPTPHRSVFYRPDALPAAQPTASKHWRQNIQNIILNSEIDEKCYFWQKRLFSSVIGTNTNIFS